jgi:enterochelin esterase-like enzyme
VAPCDDQALTPTFLDMQLRSQRVLALALFAALHAGVSGAQSITPPATPARPPLVVPDPVLGAKPVITERITVHGVSLEKNLEGDSPDHGVIVYLPPSYANSGTRRYPVLYALHGYSISNEKWTTEIHTPQTIEGAFATGTCEMIVVLANAQTRHNGSMYSNSATTGNWEDFLDLPTKNGEPQPSVLARWAANAPLAMVDQYVANLRQYSAIALDVGDRDGLRVDTAELHRILDSYGIANSFELYSGDHVSAVADRMQNHVVPFFGKHLVFEGRR